MKNPLLSTSLQFCTATIAGLWSAGSIAALAQGPTLLEDLIAYWPFDEVQGSKTPDLKSGYDLNLDNLTEAQLVPGKFGTAFAFNGTNTMAWRIHQPGDDLPAVKHKSFTVSMWARVNGAGQNDKRLFSEGSVTADPLFNIGTHNSGANGAVDIFIRQSGTQLIDHLKSFTTPFVGGAQWRHILFWQEENPDGSSSRKLFIDGVEDFLLIPNKSAADTYIMDRTSIGAVFRSGPSAYVVGDIDDVAIWKRALTLSEISDLYQNGMPDLDEAPESLAIKSFSADFDHVVEDGSVRLRWDVTKDANISLTPGPGDVTTISSFGVGSTEVAVGSGQTFTLRVERDGESIEQQITVSAVKGVAPEWHWVEDFDSRNLGNLREQGRWLVPDGMVEVRDGGVTQVVGVTAGNDLAGLALRDLQIPRSTRRTLFFRVHQNSADHSGPVNLLVGLSEKTLRSPGDFEGNAGTLIRFTRTTANGDLVLQARNGQFGPLVAADYEFLPDTTYNIWIDIQNNSFDSGMSDTFSVHVAPEGGARTTVFNELPSDREPGEVAILGFPREDIDTLIISAPGADQASTAVQLDDFYISAPNTWVSSVPRPIVPIDNSPFAITSVARHPDGTVSLTWSSQPGNNYYLQSSSDMITWPRLDNVAIPSQGESTTIKIGPFAEPFRFFRLERE